MLNAIAHITLFRGVITLNNQKAGTFVPGELHALYTQYQWNYPKFHKMDAVCKLAFSAAELLLEKTDFNPDATGIVLGTQEGCLLTDQKHADSIADRNNYFPSPAVFVYTLPNIMLGELCIRHKITGENHCLPMQQPNGQLLVPAIKDVLKNNDYCLAGWVNKSADNEGAELYLFTNSDKIQFPIAEDTLWKN